jgi:membrane-associated protein
MRELIDFVLHVDHYLAGIIDDMGIWTYAILFLIIFCETGLVVTPFLPGDSLLFAAGALAATTVMNVHLLFILLLVAAIIGDATNYNIGKYVGPRVFTTRSRLIKREHLERTRDFFERHGGKTIIMARFMPIIRTFAPFVAGIGEMRYVRFATFNVVGGVLWVAGFLYGGYFFGNLPFVEENFSLVILVIIILSLLPPVIEYLRSRSSGSRAVEATKP